MSSRPAAKIPNAALLRLAADLRLPDVQDNLEVRLLLLQRRLSERNAPVQIEKTGRGRFRLNVHHPLTLSEVAKAAGWL
jgi:adenylate cyclase